MVPGSVRTPRPFAVPSFAPAPLLGNRHTQTVWPTLFRRRPRPPLTLERWSLPDGDELVLEVLPTRPGRPGVFVLHGLEGSSAAPYARGVLAAVHAEGWNGAGVNFRSCAPRGVACAGSMLYHAGKTDDLAAVVARLLERWPSAPLGAVGFSLGGNVLLKWLGELADRAPVTAAVAISVPFDLAACARRIDGPGFWSLIYRERFLRSLRRKALAAAALPDCALDATGVAGLRTFAAFDEHVTARLFGFAGADDYWNRVSAAAFVPHIRRPTLIACADDDPFVPPAAVPHEAIARNPSLTLWRTARGGHVGFVAGPLWNLTYAAERTAVAFLEHHLSG